ncbi:MAG: cytochrome c [Alphaproteobacteria bacterium]|nr:cytochrome c [Alphaproteobacteria bacterium]
MSDRKFGGLSSLTATATVTVTATALRRVVLWGLAPIFLLGVVIAEAQVPPLAELEDGVRLTALSEARVSAADAKAFRNDMFKALNQNMRALAALTKDYDQATAENLVEEIARGASRIPHGFHPDGSAIAKSHARGDIWQNGAEFIMLAATLESSARGVLEAGVSEAGLSNALREMGGNCQACHNRFRTHP